MTDSKSLTFNDVTLRVITRNGEPWITSTDLARALGYARPDDVARLYRRNADEFTPQMTAVERLDQGSQRQSGVVTPSAKQSDTRIFSLRGAHLVAMFAKTPVAAAFRRWVLDVLDIWSAAAPPAPLSPSEELAQLVAPYDIVPMASLKHAIRLIDHREAYVWLEERMARLGFLRAWVRADAVPAGATGRIDRAFALSDRLNRPETITSSAPVRGDQSGGKTQ